jgi:Fe-S-cluster containining protein
MESKMGSVVHPTVRFQCTECGNCCKDQPGVERRILLTKDDYSRIRKLKGNGDFASRNNSERYPHIMKKLGGECVFLKENKCTIYEKRPLICQFYPFSLRSEDEKYVFGLDDKCEGLHTGNILDRKHFLSLLAKARTSTGKI